MGKLDDVFDIPEGAITVLEPAMKDPNDQLVYALEQIQQLGNKKPEVEASTDTLSLFTGRAEVTDTGSKAVFESTGPTLMDDGPPQSTLILMGIGIFAILYNFLGGK